MSPKDGNAPKDVRLSVDRSKHRVKGLALLGPDIMGIDAKCFEDFMASDNSWIRLSVGDKVYHEIPLKQLPVLTQKSTEPKWFKIFPLPYSEMRVDYPVWAMIVWEVSE